mgnify:CR=1 FL=1
MTVHKVKTLPKRRMMDLEDDDSIVRDEEPVECTSMVLGWIGFIILIPTILWLMNK